MTFRSWSAGSGLVLAAALVAGCATGDDGGDTYLGDDGGGSPGVDGSVDAPAAVGSEGGSSHEGGGRVSDAAGTADSGPDVLLEAAGYDASQDAGNDDASAGMDAPVDEDSDDASEADSGTDGGGTMEGGGGCNPQNCNGCCNGNHCVGGTSNHACGTGGGSCQDCSALGDTCASGTCQVPTGGSCSSNCAGCCDKNSACHAQASAQYCPTNNGNLFQPGGPCEDCTAAGDTQCFLDLIAYVCLP